MVGAEKELRLVCEVIPQPATLVPNPLFQVLKAVAKAASSVYEQEAALTSVGTVAVTAAGGVIVKLLVFVSVVHPSPIV